MPKLIVLITGNVSAGKTTLCEGLRRHFDSTTVKTKEVLKDLAIKKLKKELPSERKALQKFGEQLDTKTNGEWVLNALKKHIADAKVGQENVVVVDAVRILPQIKVIRKAYQFAVKHIHLEAPPVSLADRYRNRGNADVKELPKYSDVGQDPTESRVATLRQSADFVVDTERCTPDDVLARVATYLGLVTRDYSRLVDVYVGGQCGSEGKGHIISYVAREYQVLVRVGGPNAGHKVFMDGGAVTHHQLPSGTLRTDAKFPASPFTATLARPPWGLSVEDGGPPFCWPPISHYLLPSLAGACNRAWASLPSLSFRHATFNCRSKIPTLSGLSTSPGQ
jgi:adenylosuccinate synthase